MESNILLISNQNLMEGNKTKGVHYNSLRDSISFPPDLQDFLSCPSC